MMLVTGPWGPDAHLGCDFCGTYDSIVGVAMIHVKHQAFPPTICRGCAKLLAQQLLALLDGAALKGDQ